MTAPDDPHGEVGYHIYAEQIHGFVKVTSPASRQALLLARQSAQTLQNLNLLPHRDMDVGLLLIHEGGKYVEYPCLEWLRLRLTKEHTVGQVLTGGIPFPRLRRLWIDAGFPFGDDVVFGGNGRMLESLSLVVSGEVAGILHGVFTEASYPLLRSVKILVSGTNGWADTECLRFAMSIGPHALVRRIERGLEPSDISLSLLGNNSCVRVLSLASTKLSIWDMLSLIGSLPALEELATMTAVVGEALVPSEELPSYVLKTYGCVGRRQFRCWRVGYNPLFDRGVCDVRVALGTGMSQF